jgi:hypothetical protein
MFAVSYDDFGNIFTEKSQQQLSPPQKNYRVKKRISWLSILCADICDIVVVNFRWNKLGLFRRGWTQQ